jgi:DinB superfamily
MDAREFFLVHHEHVHSQVARELLQGLSDEQMRLRPNGLNSVAWLVWHMARCEDAINVLVASRPQVLDQNDWLTRLNVSLRDVGTGMTDDEVSDLSARLDLGVLRHYYHAVGRRTVEVVKSLQSEHLNESPDLHQLRAEGVFRESAMWAISEREGQTKGWWLGHLGIGHNQMHRGQALTLRGLQGIRNR